MGKKIKKKTGKLPSNTVPFSSPVHGGPEHTPHEYVLARMIDNPKQMARLDAASRKALKAKWTPSKVNALDTDAILNKLRALGVAVAKDDFERLAAGHGSAWKMSRDYGDRVDGDDDDFLGLAFCILWQRWLPNRPSAEMIEDWIRDGYVGSEKHDHDAGLEAWRRAWDGLRRMLTNDINTVDGAQRSVFQGFSSLLNWTQDYVQEHIHVSPAHVEDGIRLIDELLAQFSREEPNYRQNLLADKVAIYEVAERFDDAERAARAVIDAWPKNAIGYTTLANIAESTQRLDLAIATLERALAVPVDDAEDWDVQYRLDDLREDLRRHALTG